MVWQGWEELMLVVESAMAGARKEVALAAIGVVTTVVCTHGAAEGAMTRAMWKRALRAVGVGVEAAVSPNCLVPLMARLELVAAIGHLHVRTPRLPPAVGTHGMCLIALRDPFALNNLTMEPCAHASGGPQGQHILNLPPAEQDFLARS